MEIVAGPGTAARFGDVAIWAGPGASELLVTFLVESARNVGASPLGGARIADHIGSVLAGRDPEPGVPFACVGPDQAGTALLLHGAIQAWDGTRWLVPQPRPGWLRTEVAAGVPLSVTAHGAVSVRTTPGSDLRAGVVPAAGFSLVPEPDPAVARTVLLAAERGLVSPAGSPAPSGPSTPAPPSGPIGSGPGAGPAASGPGPAASGPGPIGESTVVDATAVVDAGRQIRDDLTETLVASAAHPPGTLGLLREGPSPLPPLPPVGQPDAPVPGQPVVAGVLCPARHFNHPAVRTCVVCRQRVTAEGGRVSGSRPALGVLVIDDGAVHRLDRSYLLGSDPRSDPTVTGGQVRPLALDSTPAIAASHAEIRLTGWRVSVVDRGSDGATQVLLPGETDWTTLRPFLAHTLRPGAHIAVGSRVVSLISPWPIDEPVT